MRWCAFALAECSGYYPELKLVPDSSVPELAICIWVLGVENHLPTSLNLGLQELSQDGILVLPNSDQTLGALTGLVPTTGC